MEILDISRNIFVINGIIIDRITGVIIILCGEIISWTGEIFDCSSHINCWKPSRDNDVIFQARKLFELKLSI